MSTHINVNETAAGAGNSRAMETRNHSNGVSLKNMRSRGSKNFFKVLFVALLSIATMSVSAQKAKEQKLSGDISSLKGQKEINIVIDFTGMTINDQPEESHIAFFTNDKDEEYKERWLTEWNVEMRNDCYKKLLQGLQKSTKKLQWSIGNFPNAENTIYVKVIDIKTGAFLMINTKLKADVSISKTGENTPFATLPYNQYGGQSSNVASPIGQIASTFKWLGIYTGYRLQKKLK